MKKTILLCAAGTLAAVYASAALVTIDFVSGDQFDGQDVLGLWDISGAQYGSVPGLTIDGTSLVDHPGHSGATWGMTAGGAGGPNGIKVDELASGDGGKVFDGGTEVWGFTINDDITSWESISVDGFTGTDGFFIQTSDWIGLSMTPTNADVTFNSTTGTITVFATNGQKVFGFADISDGTLLPVSNGTEIRFGADGGGGGVRLDAWSFNVASVPEPSTYALLLGFGALGLVLVRRRMRN